MISIVHDFSPRVQWLLTELAPFTQHSDIIIYPRIYDREFDTLYLEIIPSSAPRWSKTAQHFAPSESMKYDRNVLVYGIDGQPRVSYDGLV